MSTTTDVVTPSDRLTGRVKWFNNKAGYGFITITDGDRSGNDVFVHHSVINVENQQYKYLVQGEYVEFLLIKTTSGDHEWQASDVSGIKGGKLMCETSLISLNKRMLLLLLECLDSRELLEMERHKLVLLELVERDQEKQRMVRRRNGPL